MEAPRHNRSHGTVGASRHDHSHGREPWEAKKPWGAFGMTRSGWYKAGRPTTKPPPKAKDSGTIMSEAHAAKRSTIPSASFMAEVVRLATPTPDRASTSIPALTEELVRLGHLRPGTKATQQECVRRYVNTAKADGRIKEEWIHNGHRSDKREAVKVALPDIVKAHAPINVRGCLYKLIDAGVLTDKDDVNLVSNVLVELREQGIVDPDDIVDIRGTIQRPAGYSGLPQGLRSFNYRRDPWIGLGTRVVVGIEKAGLGDVVWPVCQEFHVPLIVPGGYGSYTLCYDTAKHIEEHDGETIVLYWGDFDPSGLCIDEAFQRRLRELAPRSFFTFERVGLWKPDITTHKVRTHAVNRNDRQSPKFIGKHGDQAADLDALDPRTLRSWVEAKIREHISDEDLARTLAAETEDRARLHKLIELLELNPDLDRLLQRERLRDWMDQVGGVQQKVGGSW